MGYVARVRVSVDCRYVRERPSGIGGYVQALVARLPELAPKAHFHFWAHPKAPQLLNPAPNCSQTVVSEEANHLPTLIWPARLAPVADAQVVHMPYNILGRGLPAPAVVTVHDLMWLNTPELCDDNPWRRMARHRFYGWGLRNAMRNAARIVAVSKTTADDLVRSEPTAAKRVEVVSHGVDARFCPAPDSADVLRCTHALLGDDQPYFLVVGQNAPYKNHTQILRAFAQADVPQVRLVLVQRLGASDRLQRLIDDLGISDRVVALGDISEDDVLALYRGALALVQFSRNEGFGMPVLEAMACGTPVIASNIPVLREVLGNAGLKVSLETAALAAAMRKLSSDESQRIELSRAGLERARAFSWDRCAQQHLELYRDAARHG